MPKKIFAIVVTLLLLNISCNNRYGDDNRYVKIKTDKGNIIVKLYKETPKHSANLIKLAENKFYDNLIFHRVIKNFVIQGGDPDTRNPKPNKLYGDNDAGYLINPEINDTIYHKSGAIGMAREGDDVNPKKMSSSSQFYIVIGKVYTNEELDSIEKILNKKIRKKIEKHIFDSLLSEQDIIKNTPLIDITQKVTKLADSLYNENKIVFTSRQREIYTTIGGIPHLDGNYTIFGEVVEGYDIVKKIAEVETDTNDRPLKDIKFSISVIK